MAYVTDAAKNVIMKQNAKEFKQMLNELASYVIDDHKYPEYATTAAEDIIGKKLGINGDLYDDILMATFAQDADDLGIYNPNTINVSPEEYFIKMRPIVDRFVKLLTKIKQDFITIYNVNSIDEIDESRIEAWTDEDFMFRFCKDM